MKGIISRTLAVKATYDHMTEDLRSMFFLIRDQGEWWRVCGFNRLNVEFEDRHGWFILYGDDDKNKDRCELVFTMDEKTGEMVPAEYTVWKDNRKTYYRLFREF